MFNDYDVFNREKLTLHCVITTQTPLSHIGEAQSRKSWQYSPDLEARKEAIKQLQKQEEESGIATVKSITTYPVFRFR